MIIDFLVKTIQFKVVYYGTAMSGKTTSIKSLFDHFGKKEEISSIESTIRRTLFFDYGVITFQNEEWKLKINIYSCTGQDFYIVTRPITLLGVDGIIFIIDSQKTVWERNLISWNELNTYFKDKIESLPLVMAFNKQDLPDKFSPHSFLKEIELNHYQNKEVRYTIALNGENVLSCFEDILRLIFMNINKSIIFPVIKDI